MQNTSALKSHFRAKSEAISCCSLEYGINRCNRAKHLKFPISLQQLTVLTKILENGTLSVTASWEFAINGTLLGSNK